EPPVDPSAPARRSSECHRRSTRAHVDVAADDHRRRRRRWWRRRWWWRRWWWRRRRSRQRQRQRPWWQLSEAIWMGTLDQLLELQERDTVIDQLRHRRATLPERAALDALAE